MFTNLIVLFLFSAAIVASQNATAIYSRTACDPNKTTLLQPPNRVNSTKRLETLRKLLSSENESFALYVTDGDEHQSEFVSDEDKRLERISGFSGSAGEAIITIEKAVLWTDGRYHIQADEQLDCNWILMRSGTADVPTKEKWLKSEFPNGTNLGANPKFIAADVWNKLETKLKQTNENFNFIQTNLDLMDGFASLFGNKSAEIKTAFTLNESYTGKNWETKVNETLTELSKLGADSMIVTALDEIAWLLNIRGQDIPYNYLLKSYVILTQNQVNLYADLKKLEGNVTNYFENHASENYAVKFKEYERFWDDLKFYSQNLSHLLVPSPCGYNNGANKKIYSLIADDKKIFEPSPIVFLKAKKNSVEIQGMEESHVKDGASMCKLLHHLETTFNAGKEWDEASLAKEVDKFRYEQGAIPSFGTIVGFGPHGALPHYAPTPSTSIKIFNNSTLVIDSGGQYFGGTTDITRTIHLGVPTEKQKQAYTRVLMGCIQLSSLIFPQNLEVSRIDVLARSALWEIGYDYLHGTGHGIGAFLGVHESPIRIRYDTKEPQFFQPGYFTSNEPGYYLKDEFGIRLENIIKVVEKPTLKDNLGKSFLAFVDVTLVPYDMKLIDLNLLNKQHINWLNAYNNRIRTLVGAELRQQKALDALHWLMEHTRHIPVTK